MLVIASPQRGYLAGELRAIERHIEGGGSLLWLLEPDQGPHPAQLLEMLGVTPLPGTVVDPNDADLGLDNPAIAIVNAYPEHPAVEHFRLVTLYPQAAALSLQPTTSWQARALLTTLPRTWNETGPLKGRVARDPEQGELAGPLVLGYSLERRIHDKTQRVIVLCDGDFLSNTYIGNGGNLDLGINLLRWLSGDEGLLDIPSRVGGQRPATAAERYPRGYHRTRLSADPPGRAVHHRGTGLVAARESVMGKRGWINLGLLALVAVLALIALRDPGREIRPGLQPLTPLDPRRIERIHIANHNGPAFLLERRDREWWMSEPHQVAANTPRIEILLDIASTPSFEHFALPRERLDEFELLTPKAELQLDDTTLIFGGTHPYNYRRYVRIGDTLHLINDHFPHHFLALAEDFVSHELLGGEARISAIRTPDWSIMRTAQGWELTPPRPGLPQERLVAKAEAWRHTLAAKVVKAPPPGSTEWVDLSLEQQPRPLRFEVIREPRHLLLVRRDLGIAYRLPSDSTLLAPPGD